MKEERLTQKEALYDRGLKYFEYYSVATEEDKNKAINQLGELEDKIEDGTLVELPCIRKVENYFYVYFNQENNSIEHCVCLSLEAAEVTLKQLKERK